MPIASDYGYKLDHSDAGEESPHFFTLVKSTCLDSTEERPSCQAPLANESEKDSTVSSNEDVNRVSPKESRQELIERIKRQQQPRQWLAHTLQAEPNQSQSTLAFDSEIGTPSLMPPIDIKERESPTDYFKEEQKNLALSIERPRSALHRGDFRGEASTPADNFRDRTSRHKSGAWFGTSPPPPWLSGRPAGVSPLQVRTNGSLASIPGAPRIRAASFVFRAPTSPLANQSNVADLENLDQHAGRTRERSSDKSSRRRTFSPSALRDLRLPHPDTPLLDVMNSSMPSRSRGTMFPYQAHQPCRSLASLDDSHSSEHRWAPSAHTRRPSLSSETSPLQRAPMVGRYEESILRGRMSSLPSRPLDFVAQIGVLGKGSCKSSLRCPPHVTVPFPAIFYHYGNIPGATSRDGPSPYVGLIDLDKHASAVDNQELRRRRSRELQSAGVHHSDIMDHDTSTPRVKPSRSSRGREGQFSKDGPRGGYRIPEQGQVQVIIRNPNKTAVKLFLIPYDLKGMEPGQKTFIRQRSYSAGPILDAAPDTRNKLDTDRFDVALANSKDSRERPVLRYLIHLHICCISRGRYFLYKSIRIVFANRVPDGKEKLRQEIQLPEPRFTTYKPECTEKRSVASGCEAVELEKGTSVPRKEVKPFSAEAPIGQYPNFAWESSVQQDSMRSPFQFLPVDIPGLPSISDTSTSTVKMSQETPTELPPTILPDQTASANERANLPQFPPSVFERLGREEWTPCGAPPRTNSPHLGEGLISQQYRHWSVQNVAAERQRERSRAEEKISGSLSLSRYSIIVAIRNAMWSGAMYLSFIDELGPVESHYIFRSRSGLNENQSDNGLEPVARLKYVEQVAAVAERDPQKIAGLMQGPTFGFSAKDITKKISTFYNIFMDLPVEIQLIVLAFLKTATIKVLRSTPPFQGLLENLCDQHNQYLYKLTVHRLFRDEYCVCRMAAMRSHDCHPHIDYEVSKTVLEDIQDIVHIAALVMESMMPLIRQTCLLKQQLVYLYSFLPHPEEPERTILGSLIGINISTWTMFASFNKLERFHVTNFLDNVWHAFLTRYPIEFPSRRYLCCHQQASSWVCPWTVQARLMEEFEALGIFELITKQLLLTRMVKFFGTLTTKKCSRYCVSQLCDLMSNLCGNQARVWTPKVNACAATDGGGTRDFRVELNFSSESYNVGVYGSRGNGSIELELEPKKDYLRWVHMALSAPTGSQPCWNDIPTDGRRVLSCVVERADYWSFWEGDQEMDLLTE
ncbi:hypothetical protein FH972_021467 [Carpinus fangiana]|uniref:Atos-like conserved domain-containing protein n=1 Tax=Carpinus fangiana TaxID=176857 RepID=A0A5N6KPS2_9ROSI|nr:hypothetical protein FH972_021467 [Carpinus fangiana]